MSSHSKKLKISAIFSLIIFFGCTIFSFSTLKLFDELNWTNFLEKINESWFSLVLGVVFFPILGGIVLFFILAYWERTLLKPIESSLHSLKTGSQIREDKNLFGVENESIFHKSITDDLYSIQSTIQDLSRELQTFSSKPHLFNGKTQEEILENERHRLARELHDSVSQELFAAMMMLSAINEISSQTSELHLFQKQLQMVTDIINRAQSEMRALLLHLRPVNLEGKSLKIGIEQLLKELKTKVTIKITWSIQDLQLSTTIEDQLFRVTQELLSNTLRHSKAEELEVYLHQVDQSILLRFIDDGVGFDTTSTHPGSYGLINIQERIQNLGGNVKIISFKNQGTSVEIKVPLLSKGA